MGFILLVSPIGLGIALAPFILTAEVPCNLAFYSSSEYAIPVTQVGDLALLLSALYQVSATRATRSL